MERLAKKYSKYLCAAYEGLGGIATMRGEYEKATRFYEKMSQLAIHDSVLKARSKYAIADIQVLQSKYRKALKTLNEMEKIISGKSEGEIIERCEMHLLKCWIYNLTGKLKKAIQEGTAGLQEIDNHGTFVTHSKSRVQSLKAKAYNTLGTVYYYKGYYTRAITLFHKFSDISEAMADKRDISLASVNLGSAYFKKGAYNKAIPLFKKCLAISEELEEKQVVGLVHSHLGAAYLTIGERVKAQRCFHLALSIAEDIKDKRGIGTAAYHLGELYLNNGAMKRASRYLEKAEILLKEIGNKYMLISVYRDLAILKMKSSDKKSKQSYEALKCNSKALTLAQKMNSRFQLARCYRVHGRIYGCNNNGKSAHFYFKKALKIIARSHHLKELAETYRECAEVLQRCDDQKNHFTHFVRTYQQKAQDIEKQYG